MTSRSVGMGDQYLVRMIVDQAARLGLTWAMRPATVTAAATATAAPKVTIDGDTIPVACTSLVGLLYPGQRVMVLLTPPSGIHAIGRLGDFGWKTLVTGNSWAGRAGYQGPCYRLVPYPENHVEIVAHVVNGTATNGILLATLPVGYRPAHIARIPMSGGTGSTGHVSGTAEIATNGEITMWDFVWSGAWCQSIVGMFPLDL